MTPPRRPVPRMIAVALALSLWGAAVVPAGASPASEPGNAGPTAASGLADTDTFALAADDPGGRVLVWWRSGTSASTRAALAGTEVAGLALTDDVEAFDVGRTRTAGLVAALEGRPEVEAVTVDRMIEIAATRPDDPLFAQQWGLENTGALVIGGRIARAGVDVRALGAWELTRGEASVTVAVVDTGVDLGHPDLAGALWRNPGETMDGRDSDGNGLIDDMHGWDFVRNRSSIYEDATVDRHGTQVAGVIAARSNDGIGVAGIAPGVKLMVLKAFASDPVTGTGQGSLSTVVPALLYAAAEGADLINASWVTAVDDPLLRQVISRAGVPVVAAAGNGDGTGRGLDLSAGGRAFPASYDLPNLITVTALDHQGLVPAFANRGASTVHVGAPGAGVLTVQSGGGHTSASGTSFSAPFVSGAIALAASVAPYATTTDLVDALERTTRFETGLVGLTTTGGMVDAAALVRGVQRPVCRPDRQPRSNFRDVARDGVHTTSIDCLVAQQVALGRDAGTFAPAATVTRGQMATFLARVLDREGVAPPAGAADAPAFLDIAGHPHEASIATLAALNVVRVGPDQRFRPNQPVTRGQVASLLARTHAVAVGRDVEPTRAWFTDVADSVHSDNIARARDLGIVRGTDRVRYAPGERLRRDQMASVLARLLDALERERSTGDPSADTGM
jgi:subtilisin family serine protease